MERTKLILQLATQNYQIASNISEKRSTSVIESKSAELGEILITPQNDIKIQPCTMTMEEQPSNSTLSVELQPSTPSTELQPSTISMEVQPSTFSIKVQPPTMSTELQPFTMSKEVQPFTYLVEEQPSTSSTEVQPSTSSMKVQPSTSSAAYSVKQRSITKLRLRRLPTIPCRRNESSSEDEDNLWGEDSDNYVPSEEERSSESESSNQTLSATKPCEALTDSPPTKKGKKRVRNPEKWTKTKAKLLKNTGKSYTSSTGKIVSERSIGPHCSNKCILKCPQKLSDDCRIDLFQKYWNLTTLQRQRDFLASCIEPLQMKFRRISTRHEPRRKNCAFYLLNNGKRIRVCKSYLINTFGITERTLRTVIQSRASGSGIVPEDKRGRHGKHKQIDPEILNSVRTHINSIPRIESHYQRENTSREFIDGGLSIAEMHRNYKTQRLNEGKPAANYDYYARIFNTEFNIGFFVPKKDQCDVCEAFKNSTEDEKAKLENEYQIHQEEKKLSRAEKATDKENAKREGSKMVLATYDLQAVLPVPMGQSSAFFYKSKLNCFNFTVSEICNDNNVCYFWHEGLAHRGAIEIGTCVLKFIEEVANARSGADIVFYSDNCCGQQKNRFILAMCLYAVERLQINSITHKYLIRGHTQNEGDTVHSIIEKSIKRAKKSGPIYVPDQLVSIIRNSKKTGNPLIVKEMSYNDFVDLKSLNSEIGINCQKNINGEQIKLSDIKLVRFVKGSRTFYYKKSYKETEWEEVESRTIGTRRSSEAKNKSLSSIILKPAYNSKMLLSENKKRDLQGLLSSNIIPKYYEIFFNGLF